MPNSRYLNLIDKLLAYFLALPLVSMKIKRSPDRVIQTRNLASKSPEKIYFKFRHLNEVSKTKRHEPRFYPSRLFPAEAVPVVLFQ